MSTEQRKSRIEAHVMMWKTIAIKLYGCPWQLRVDGESKLLWAEFKHVESACFGICWCPVLRTLWDIYFEKWGLMVQVLRDCCCQEWLGNKHFTCFPRKEFICYNTGKIFHQIRSYIVTHIQSWTFINITQSWWLIFTQSCTKPIMIFSRIEHKLVPMKHTQFCLIQSHVMSNALCVSINLYHTHANLVEPHHSH